VRFVRRFGYPGRIDPFERIWLTFTAIEGSAEVTLNSQLLGTLVGGGEFEVTSLLRIRNELRVDIEADSDRGGLWGDVALEVRRTAFLKDITLRWSDRRLEVSGQVVGDAERPLELYVILGRFNVGYGMVSAGQPFVLTTDDIADRPPDSVRVELIDGAVIWYAVELVLPSPH
jgi:hypothetical protein